MTYTDDEAHVLAAVQRVEALIEKAERTQDGSVEQVLARRWKSIIFLSDADADVKAQQLADIEDAARAESRVRQDYTGRYPVELLQNAHDACHDAGIVGRAWVQVTPTALLVGNEGAGFSTDRVDALLRLGASSKRQSDDPAHHTIGYKGIGFSSVFEVSDTPQIISADAAFAFDRRAATAAVRYYLGDVERVPIRRYPFLLSSTDWSDDAAAVRSLLEEGAVTIVRLPFRHGVDAGLVGEAVIDSLRPEALLFMDSLDGLTLDVDGSQRWTRTTRPVGGDTVRRLEGPDPREWLVRTTTRSIEPDLVTRLDDDLWQDVKWVNCAVAMPWCEDAPDPDRGQQSVSVYFPTEDLISNTLLVHGDFYVDSSRRHIEPEGAGGEISLTVAKAVAELVAGLAEDLVDHGNALLACLARRHQNSGFGGRLTFEIDQALRSAAFLRRAHGDNPAKPDEVKRAGTHLGEDAELMVSMFEDPSDLMRVGDDRSVGQWLSDFGCGALDARQVAHRLAPAAADVDYEVVLAAIERFQRRPASRGVEGILRTRPIVQDVDRNWCAPTDVVLSVTAGPELPEAIRPTQLLAPRDPQLLDFVTGPLGVETLTDDNSLQLLLSALEERRFGIADEERIATLRFLRQLADHSHDVVAAHKDRIARLVEVPVVAAGGGLPGWTTIADTYFREADVPDSSAEAILGVLGVAEFLDHSRLPPADGWTDLCSKLGVARDPRTERLTVDCSVHGYSYSHDTTAGQQKWIAGAKAAGGLVCASGHPQVERRLTASLLDRLDEALPLLGVSGGHRLAEYLSGLNEPFGGRSASVCLGSEHRGHAPKKEVPGIQDMLLRETPWVPATEPDGSESLRLIRDVWFDVSHPGVQLIVPVAGVSDEAAEALGITQGDDPGRDAIERALVLARGRYADLAEAPVDVQNALSLLMSMLDAAIKSGADEPGECPPLPCSRLGRPEWSASPLVADVCDGDDLDANVLPPPGRWSGLREAYGLARVSDVADIDVGWDGLIESTQPLLDRALRARLIALLTAEGGKLPDLAAAFGSMEEVQCTGLLVTVTVPDKPSVLVTDRRCHVLPRSDETLDLFVVVDGGDWDALSVAEQLAEILDCADHQDLIALALTLGERVLQSRGITGAELERAEQALAKYSEVQRRPTRSRQLPRNASDTDRRDGGTSDAAVAEPRPPADRAAPTGAERDVWDVDGHEVTADDLAGIDDGWPDSPSGNKESPRGGGDERERARRVSGGDADSISEVDADRVSFEPHPGVHPAASRGDRTYPADRRWRERQRESPNEEDRRVAEDNAMRIVQRYLEQELGMRVEDVSHRNLGWDLEASLNDETWQVEVKGLSGRPTTFILTVNERNAAQNYPNFKIALVGHNRHNGGDIHLLSDIEQQLQEDDLTPMAWSINGWAGWDGITSWIWGER